MIYSKNKYNINKSSIKRQYIYTNPSKKLLSTQTKENNNYTKISDIYKFTYEDYFPMILTYRTKELFNNEINKKALNFLKNNFSDQELNSAFIKISIKKIKEEIFTKINKEYTILRESLNNIKKFQKKVNFVTHFRKHCGKTQEIACHLCDDGQKGKFIEIKSKYSLTKNDINYVICDKCNYCYTKNFIKMFCVPCDKNYYSEILKDNEDVNCLPATWSNYHCGTRIKEIMKCLKCKNILYLNLKNNKLICLNKNCNFCIRPENIIWECYLCNSEFKSPAKIYNPLELEIVNKTINRAILYKNKAIPSSLPCCNGEINDKLIFYHKKECKGLLYKSFLNNKEIVICEKCHALNSFDRFSWLCPLCGKYFRLNERIKSHDYSNSSVLPTNHKKSVILGKSNYNNILDLKGIINSKSKENNTQTNRNINKGNTPNSITNNYFNFGLFIKKNKTNDTSYDRNRKNPNVSEDFSFMENKNKSSINVNLKENKDKENENNVENKKINLIKVTKSIEQTDRYGYNKRRKRRTLYEILNSRKNTPITNNKRNIFYDKES